MDLGYSEKAVARLKVREIEVCALTLEHGLTCTQKPKKDDEFLMCRIIFLTSYGTTQSFMNLIDKHKLADFVNDVGICNRIFCGQPLTPSPEH